MERSLALEIRVGTSERGEVLIYVEHIRGGYRGIGPAKRVSIPAEVELCKIFAFPISCGQCAARMSWSMTMKADGVVSTESGHVLFPLSCSEILVNYGI